LIFAGKLSAGGDFSGEGAILQWDTGDAGKRERAALIKTQQSRRRVRRFYTLRTTSAASVSRR